MVVLSGVFVVVCVVCDVLVVTGRAGQVLDLTRGATAIPRMPRALRGAQAHDSNDECQAAAAEAELTRLQESGEGTAEDIERQQKRQEDYMRSYWARQDCSKATARPRTGPRTTSSPSLGQSRLNSAS